jgi:hypothetical protein
MTSYLAGLTPARTVLWCYFLWYLVVLARYFDPSPRLWLTSLGLSGIIGLALLLNAGSGKGAARLDRWQRFRFFLTPLCVSSFSALVKDKGFLLIFSPGGRDVAMGVGACAAFLGVVALCRAAVRRGLVAGRPIGG